MFGLQWSTQVTVGDVLTFVGLVGGLIGLVFVAVQVRAGAIQVRIGAEQAKAGAEQAQQTATAQRGRFLLDVVNRYLDDPEMFRLHNLIDNKGLAFEPDVDLEPLDISRAISRTFYYFDTVKFLVDRDLISLEDVAILRYRIITFFESPQVSEVLHGRRSGRSHELAQELYKQLKRLPPSLRGIG